MGLRGDEVTRGEPLEEAGGRKVVPKSAGSPSPISSLQSGGESSPVHHTPSSCGILSRPRWMVTGALFLDLVSIVLSRSLPMGHPMSTAQPRLSPYSLCAHLLFCLLLYSHRGSLSLHWDPREPSRHPLTAMLLPAPVCPLSCSFGPQSLCDPSHSQPGTRNGGDSGSGGQAHPVCRCRMSGDS